MLEIIGAGVLRGNEVNQKSVKEFDRCAVSDETLRVSLEALRWALVWAEWADDASAETFTERWTSYARKHKNSTPGVLKAFDTCFCDLCEDEEAIEVALNDRETARRIRQAWEARPQFVSLPLTAALFGRPSLWQKRVYLTT